MNLSKISEKIVAFMAEKNLKQRELAKHAGVHQSQISRIINEDFKTISKNVKKLCNYANINPDIAKKSDVKPQENHELMEAIESVWDGISTKKAKALAKVIKSLKGLCD